MTLPSITALPTTPNRNNQATFSDDADAFLGALPLYRTELMAFGDAVEAAAQATNYNATSTTSLTVGTGSKALTIETGKLYSVGQFVLIANTTTPANYMYGQVTAHNATTGALTVLVSAIGGSGTFTAWSVSLGATLANYATLTGAETLTNKTINSASNTLVLNDINGGQLAGNRNRIINGAMRIDQRNAGASQTFTSGAALAYCVDRFYGYCTGANITGQRVALANGQNRYRFTGAASNTAVGFAQRIEAVNSRELAGTTATLSVKLSSSSLTSITWTAYYANTADTFGTLAVPTRTQIATGTFTINSTEATYSTNISIPSAAITGIEIVLTGGALLGTQTLTIGDMQLENGAVATPFERIPYGSDLVLCQRYYETGSTRSTGYAASAISTGSGSVYFMCLKRVVPTVTLSNKSYGNATAVSSTTPSVTGTTIDTTAAAAGSFAAVFTYAAEAEL